MQNYLRLEIYVKIRPLAESQPIGRLPKNCRGWLGRRDDPLYQTWWRSAHGVFWGKCSIDSIKDNVPVILVGRFMLPRTMDGESIMFTGRASVRPSVVRIDMQCTYVYYHVTTGVFTIGPLGPCPPPLWVVDRKCSKLKSSYTAVIAARVAKQRRQRDSVWFVHKTVKVVPFLQTLLPPLLQVFRRLRLQLNESSAASQEHIPTGIVSNNTAAPSTLQNIVFWNIDGAAKHLFIAAVNCVTNFFSV